MSQPWLLVGALAVETGPVIAALERPRPWSLRAVSGLLGGVPVVVLSCGVGPAKAMARTAAMLAELEPRAVVSFGTCGALVDHLATGTLVTASQVSHDDDEPVEIEPLFGLEPTRLVTVPVPVWTAERREHYASRGHQAVEMEAAAVLAATRAWSAEVPVHALKVVSDQAGGEPDPGLGKPRELRPMVVGRFLARAKRLCSRVLVPGLREGLQLG